MDHIVERKGASGDREDLRRLLNGHAAIIAHERSMTDSPRLLEPHELAELGPPEAVRIPLGLIDENPRNPRKSSAEIAELSQSIRDFGLLQPITVRRQGDRYELLGGHRRRAAFLLLAEAEPFNVAWRTIPAVIKTLDDDQSYLALLAGQLHSRNWAPREEAAALESLASTRTLEAVGRLVHKSRIWVSHRLRVYSDSVLSGYVQTGRLSMSVADELRLVTDPAVRRELAERAIAEEWERSTARKQVRMLKIDRQIREIGRQARTLLETLSVIDATRLPPDTAKDLWALQRRIVALGRGQVLPSIAEAQRLAGVNPDAKPRREKKRRRTMPAPS